MSKLKVLKKGKYFEVLYLTEITEYPWMSSNNIWCLNKSGARKYIDLLCKIEKQVKWFITETNSKVNPELVILHHLKAIDSISSGFDIRSKMSVEELADRFVYGYTEKHNEAVKFCEDTLKYVDNVGKYGSYMSEWKRYDKHNDMIKTFLLDDIKSLTLDDFRVNELNRMGELLDDMLSHIKNESSSKSE